MTIADRIRNRRLELGLSVDDLAKLLHKNRATVYRYESNYIKSYSPDVLETLAHALQTTPAYFYGYDESDPEEPKNEDIRLLINGLNRLSPEQVAQAKEMMKIMFAQYADYFEKEKEDETP